MEGEIYQQYLETITQGTSSVKSYQQYLETLIRQESRVKTSQQYLETLIREYSRVRVHQQYGEVLLVNVVPSSALVYRNYAEILIQGGPPRKIFYRAGIII